MRKELGNNPKIKKCGSIIVTAEQQELSDNNDVCIMTPVADLPDKKGLNFFIVYRWNGPNMFVPIYKSEIKRASNNGLFAWNQVHIKTDELCKNDVDRDIKIEFFRSETSGKHKYLGTSMMNLGMIKEG